MDKERFALQLSVAGSIFMALLGIGFAILTSSEAVMLDGLFSLITFVMSLLTLKVASLIKQGESPRFQFGYNNFEPLLNMVKGLIILILSVFAFASSVNALLHGGRELLMGMSILYSFVATIGCFAVALVLKKYSKHTHSPLVRVDAANWMIDGFISSGVALTFMVAYFLKHTEWRNFVPYIDPILVCIIVVSVINTPIQTIREGINQLLGSSPDPELERKTRERINVLVDEYSFEQSKTRMVMVGRLFYVLIQVLVPKSFALTHVRDLDKTRNRFNESITDLHPGLVVDVVFTEDPRWLK